MGLNNTPMSERVHIGFFGRRNAGKSSVMNAVTGQDLAVVSDVKGTTTDPVYKSMELLPIGPVVMIDTPGIDDEGELGKLRVKKSYQTLNKTDAAVLVIDAAAGVSGEDKKLLEKIKAKKIPYVVALNKKELAEEEDMERIKKELDSDGGWIIEVSAAAGDGICELKEKIAAAVHQEETENVLVRDLLHPSDIVVLVVPVDSAAPKGRLILPQQQVIRDILEAEAVSVVVKENGLKNILDQLKENPRMVITDSQVFKKVSKDTPADVPLTSFSILMARYKGNLEQAVRGVTELDRLKDGDVVLISEGCTHHRQCEDIGTVKIPRWIIEVSAAAGDGICELKEKIAAAVHQEETENVLVRDLLHPSDIVVLVVPVDSAAPKGRLILPQQQVIRDILEAEAVSVVVKENGLKNILDQLKENPRMVITDSQVFKKVSKDTPADVPLTSFSILMARYKGNLEQAVRGVTELDRLKDGDVVLISEGCTHHRQCEDIGTVKIPRWIREYTGKEIQIETTSGTEFPDDLSKYKLIIHCGGCMLNEREMKYRMSCATDQKTTMTNYGIAIAYMKGILKRSVEAFPEISRLLEQ